MGDSFNNGLGDPSVPKHLGAKSRWIIQGFHDPDIALLNRSVPTPETADVPLALQMLASIKAAAFVGDVRSAFSQGLKGQRTEPLFASPPPGGVPGEDDDILIELLAEVYGLVTGPPGWRKSLLVKLKELDFKRHPLAPCVALMYDNDGEPDQEPRFCGLLVIETDDLLGGGVGDKFEDAIIKLKKKFSLWKVGLTPKRADGVRRTLAQTTP